MSALKNMLASAAFCTLAAISAHTAYAQNASGPSIASNVEFTVPAMDVSAKSYEEIEAGAKFVSKNSFVLSLYDHDESELFAANNAAAYLRDQGAPIVIMYGTRNQKPSAETYIGGHKIFSSSNGAEPVTIRSKDLGKENFYINILIDSHKSYKKSTSAFSTSNDSK